MQVRNTVNKRRWYEMAALSSTRGKLVLFAYMNVVFLGVVAFLLLRQQHSSLEDSHCAISLGNYGGKIYSQQDTLESKCLVESKFLKVQQHKVRVPGSDSVIDDWLWIDYHDRINVLVEDDVKQGEARRFIVFDQTKYALEERRSLAIVGGIIEPGESAESAARREVEEETGSYCENYVPLGRFRTDVNRGMGWVNSFLATNCSSLVNGRRVSKTESEGPTEEVGVTDMEDQHRISITVQQLLEASKFGRFLEVQWSNTVSLALLHGELSEDLNMH